MTIEVSTEPFTPSSGDGEAIPVTYSFSDSLYRTDDSGSYITYQPETSRMYSDTVFT